MKFKKPKFWDYKEPNIIAYLLLPFSYLINFINFFLKKKKIKTEKIKTICVGNIYLGGTGKTPISIKINKIINNLNFTTTFIKKKYPDQEDEQKILATHGKLICKKDRVDALKEAINKNINVAIFDDGLQDRLLSYDVSFVCFNIQNWIGNGLCIPSGPLRESLKSLKKYDAIFLNGNGQQITNIENLIKKINPKIEIFNSKYIPLNLKKIDVSHRYLAFSGIGSPQTFIKTLEQNSFKIIKSIDFPDHYMYSDKDIKKIKDMANNLNLKIITTEKDYNRLNEFNSEGIEYLNIELKVLNEEKLINFLNKKL